jgi:transcriptional regulator with XRE-family HTH domain
MGRHKLSLQSVTPHVTQSAMTHALATARKSANLSQQALADIVGKDRVTIARIENAQQRPSLETVSKIITALREKNVELSADAFLVEPTKASAA